MRNCIVAQSGGPTTAINASLAGVLAANEEYHYYDTVYGSLNGVTGILNRHLLCLTEQMAETENFVQKLKVTPAMYLGSCRYKLPDYEQDPAVYEKIFAFFEEYEIAAFFYIGGNDSMDTVSKLSRYGKKIGSQVCILGIPKTIDNDLILTDHTPGFGSAAKYVATSILEVARDTYIYAVKSVLILEVMGRDAGWLTAASALARQDSTMAPHLIYLPEVDFSYDAFLADINGLLEKQDHIVVAISEGIHDKDGNYISASDATTDQFGHSQLNGAGKALEHFIQEKLDIKVRSVEVNVLQRCAAHLASLTDLDESMALGKKSYELSMDGASGLMSTLVREPGDVYQTHTDSCHVDEVANVVKSVPREWINEAGNDVTEEMMDYLRPLIVGEPEIAFENGLPCYLPIPHLFTNR